MTEVEIVLFFLEVAVAAIYHSLSPWSQVSGGAGEDRTGLTIDASLWDFACACAAGKRRRLILVAETAIFGAKIALPTVDSDTSHFQGVSAAWTLQACAEAVAAHVKSATVGTVFHSGLAVYQKG